MGTVAPSARLNVNLSNARVLRLVRRGSVEEEKLAYFLQRPRFFSFSGEGPASDLPWGPRAAHQRTSIHEQTVDKARLLVGETAC